MMAMTSPTSSSSVRSPDRDEGGGGGYPLSLRDGRAGERTRGEDAHYDDAAAKWVCGVVFFGRQRRQRRDSPLKSQGASLPPSTRYPIPQCRRQKKKRRRRKVSFMACFSNRRRRKREERRKRKMHYKSPTQKREEVKDNEALSIQTTR